MAPSAIPTTTTSETALVPHSSDIVPLSAVEVGTEVGQAMSPVVDGYPATEHTTHDAHIIKAINEVRKSSKSASPILATEPERKIADIIDEKKIGRHMGNYKRKQSMAELQSSKQKSQFYGEAFAYREPVTSVRDRYSRESMVIAELKTNVIVKDEYTLITDLSYSLSSRYQRPESAIAVSLAHSACLLFGGTFDPAYILTVTALPSQLQLATNKRNAALLQSLLTDLLGVPPDRGVVKFIPIPEENLATNGLTVRSGIDTAERSGSIVPASAVSPHPPPSVLSNGVNGHSHRTMSVDEGLALHGSERGLGRNGTTRSTRTRQLKSPPLPPVPMERIAEKRNAWMRSSETLPLPPLPAPTTKERPHRVGRRKSLLSLFGR